MRKLTALLFLSLVLAGCAGRTPAETTVPTSLPTETAIVTTAPTQPPMEPPTTEPEIILPAGDGITVDGDKLESGSVVAEGVFYVKLSEFLNALDGCEAQGNEADGYSLAWEGHTFLFSPEKAVPEVDGAAASLAHEMMVYQDCIYIPLEETCALMNLSVLDDENLDHLYCTSGISGWEIPEGIQVPVLMYHAVSDNCWGIDELFVSPSNMEAQLQYLVENGYDPIFFEDLGNLDLYDKPVILTFDDGYMDNYTELYPLLQKYQVKATIFIITETIGVKEVSLTKSQCKEMSDSGLVSIQSHTLYHLVLDEYGYEKQLEEISRSKIAVARITGREPIALCYPEGGFNDTTRSLTMEYYRFGIAMNGGMYTTGEDVSRVSRYYVSRYTSLSEFAAMIAGAGI